MSQHESWHRRLLEHRSALFTVLVTVGISIGGIVEIVPMFTASAGADTLESVTPYTALEQAGRDIYVREGCYNCHSQMVRPFRAETLRYGPWSRAGEYAYDHPFQLGSRRIGPDLHRVGGKYPDAWHYEHMRDPRSTSPGSLMPPYPWLLDDTYTAADAEKSVRALATVGVPYTEADIANVATSVSEQSAGIVERLKTAGIQTEGDKEIVALIAYLQRLGKDGKAAFADSGVPDALARPEEAATAVALGGQP
jgi:cytochrome c oxidase cbb3-type subunit I/II